MILNTRKYIEKFIKIRNKQSEIVPLQLNFAQQRLYSVIQQLSEEKKPIRIIILKARQLGFSTVTSGIITKQTSTHKNTDAAIVAHKDDASTNLFNMYKLMYNNLPEQIRPEKLASNAKELVFNNRENTGLNSRVRCMTAGAEGIGRSFTLKYLHISELAFWQGDVKATLLGLFQAVPNTPDSMIIIESTANGYETYQEMWEAATRGESDFYPLFVGWNENPEYSMKYDGFDMTEEEHTLQETYSLTNEQIAWRRWCIKNNCGGDIELFHQEYPITPEEAFRTTGACVFDQQKIQQRLDEIRRRDYTPLVGQFDYGYDDTQVEGKKIIDYRFEPLEKGMITVYKSPQPSHTYTLSCDTAGDTQGDYFASHVIDDETGEQVAVYHHQTDETLFARQMYCLGYYYNEALIAIESNFSTYPIKEIHRLGYTNLYIREREDTYMGGIQPSYGFRTTSITRPLVISSLVDIIRDHIQLINDEKTLLECLTFIVNENGRKEAMKGKHDDLVMSLGIGYYVRNNKIFKVNGVTEELPVLFKWSEDLKQDYYRADEATRKRMEEKYGRIN